MRRQNKMKGRPSAPRSNEDKKTTQQARGEGDETKLDSSPVMPQREKETSSCCSSNHHHHKQQQQQQQQQQHQQQQQQVERKPSETSVASTVSCSSSTASLSNSPPNNNNNNNNKHNKPAPAPAPAPASLQRTHHSDQSSVLPSLVPFDEDEAEAEEGTLSLKDESHEPKKPRRIKREARKIGRELSEISQASTIQDSVAFVDNDKEGKRKKKKTKAGTQKDQQTAGDSAPARRSRSRSRERRASTTNGSGKSKESHPPTIRRSSSKDAKRPSIPGKRSSSKDAKKRSSSKDAKKRSSSKDGRKRASSQDGRRRASSRDGRPSKHDAGVQPIITGTATQGTPSTKPSSSKDPARRRSSTTGTSSATTTSARKRSSSQEGQRHHSNPKVQEGTVVEQKSTSSKPVSRQSNSGLGTRPTCSISEERPLCVRPRAMGADNKNGAAEIACVAASTTNSSERKSSAPKRSLKIEKAQSDRFLDVTDDYDVKKDFPPSMSMRSLEIINARPQRTMNMDRPKSNAKTSSIVAAGSINFSERKMAKGGSATTASPKKTRKPTSSLGRRYSSHGPNGDGRTKSKKASALHESYHGPSSKNTLVGSLPGSQKSRSDRFLLDFANDNAVPIMPLKSPMRILSPESTPRNVVTFGTATTNISSPRNVKKSQSQRSLSNTTTKPAATEQASRASRSNAMSRAKQQQESILNFREEDWNSEDDAALEPKKAQSFQVRKKKPTRRATMTSLGSNTWHGEPKQEQRQTCMSVGTTTRHEEQKVDPKQRNAAIPEWRSSAMAKAASIFQINMDEWKSDSDSEDEEKENPAPTSAVAKSKKAKDALATSKHKKDKTAETKATKKNKKLPAAGTTNKESVKSKTDVVRQSNIKRSKEPSKNQIVETIPEDDSAAGSRVIKFKSKAEVDEEEEDQRRQQRRMSNSSSTKDKKSFSRLSALKSNAKQKKESFTEFLSRGGQPQHEDTVKGSLFMLDPMLEHDMSPLTHATKYGGTHKPSRAKRRAAKKRAAKKLLVPVL